MFLAFIERGGEIELSYVWFLSVWVCNLVADIAGGKEAEGI